MPISNIEQQTLRQLEAELTGELDRLFPEAVNAARQIRQNPLLTKQQFHAVIGHWNNTLVDAVRTQFSDPNDFIGRWLRGLQSKVLEDCVQDASGTIIDINGAASVRLLRLVQNPVVWEYTYNFLTRNFYRNLIERTRAKPQDMLWDLWFGNNGLEWGLLIAPDYRDGQWRNDKSEIRRASYDYWTVGHILTTGLIDPTSSTVFHFNTVSDLIQFYRSVLRRVSNSVYEQGIADRYATYLLNSSDVASEPFLIPELRYAGLGRHHEHRLDYALLNSHTMEFVGFELSPQSTHMAVSGIRTTTQREMNESLLRRWESEMTKRNHYFEQFGITTMTFTDTALQNLDSCFSVIARHLSARPAETVSVSQQLATIRSM